MTGAQYDIRAINYKSTDNFLMRKTVPYQNSAEICLFDVSMSKQCIHKRQVDSDTLQNLKQEQKAHTFQNSFDL